MRVRCLHLGRSGLPCPSPTATTDCRFGTGHGASVGSLGDAWVHNITFNRIQFDGTTTAMRIKTDTGTSGEAWDITYSNLQTNNVGETLSINMFYSDDEDSCGHTSPAHTTMKVRNINFVNITAHGSGSPGGFQCDPDSPCHSLLLDNVVHSDSSGSWQCSHAFGTTTQPVSPTSCLS